MTMTPESRTVVVMGSDPAGVVLRIGDKICRLDDHVRSHGERLAGLEGKVDALV